MPTLDRPFFAVVVDSVCPRHRFRCRRSVLVCEPKYRVLRAVVTVARLKSFIHPGLRALMTAHWHAIRMHSSWSRA